MPSPNVTEDHQTHNAMALVKKDAALLVKDAEAPERLMEEACRLVNDVQACGRMEKNISGMARRDAAGEIVKQIYSIAGKDNGKVH